DFFRTGGHSLRVMRLVNVYHQQLHMKVTVQELFTHTTIAAQALLLTSRTQSVYEGIEQVPLAADYALSDGQRRLWLLSQQAGSSRAYHISGSVPLEGAYHAVFFEQAILHAMARHEILRTVFRENAEGELRQVVLPASASAFRFTSVDATQYTKEEIAACLDTQATQVFDLANGPLLRAGLLHTGEQRYILHFNLHHIISDGWSMELLSREVLEYYRCFERGEVPAEAPLRIQYKDYAAWQQQQLSGADFTADRHYWEEQLSGELPVLALPAEKVRPAVLTYNGYALSTVIDERTVADLQALCTHHQSTLFMGLLGVLNGLLYRYSGQEDIIVGSPVAGRGHGELEDQLGFYVNTLALRTRFDGRSSFAALLESVREVTLAAYEHQQYPFDRLVDDLNIRRDMSRSVVFDVMMALQQQEAVGDDSEVTGQIVEKGACAVKLDLHISFITSGGRLYMDVQYNSDVFEKATMVRLMDHFRSLLTQVIATPDMPVSRLAYLSASEEQQLLQTFNDTAITYPSGVT
ncbi:condensation domain-containing protein, partial [Chitinophaga varians]|uniref:condensation domain-containing protein n=1 Tax=Chitinophaga varians TaxID=2202339 RepID=UPI0019C5C4CD